MMKKLLKKTLPQPVFDALKSVNNQALKVRYKYLGRPKTEGETTTAKLRRVRENFFENFCKGSGLDIGYGGDILTDNCKGWDYEDGDAQYLSSLGDSEFDFVYSSHTLEHMVDAGLSLQNWWRVLKPGGFLIVYIPHRDLYEKKTTLPSRWNADHKHFFLPDADEPPDTIGVKAMIERSLTTYEVIYIRECREGWTISDPLIHSNGEYSIEFVLRKLV